MDMHKTITAIHMLLEQARDEYDWGRDETPGDLLNTALTYAREAARMEYGHPVDVKKFKAG